MSNPHSVMRSYRRDDEVKERKLADGTVRRVLGYARPYKVLVIGFLITLVIDALFAPNALGPPPVDPEEQRRLERETQVPLIRGMLGAG
jgi:hypothetical protein